MPLLECVRGGARTDISAGGQRVQPSGNRSENAPETFSQSPPVSTRSTYASAKGGERSAQPPWWKRSGRGRRRRAVGKTKPGRLRGGRWHKENAFYYYRTYVPRLVSVSGGGDGEQLLAIAHVCMLQERWMEIHDRELGGKKSATISSPRAHLAPRCADFARGSYAGWASAGGVHPRACRPQTGILLLT